jgi:hydrogenase nickel incorporation protein HypA/HybF
MEGRVTSVHELAIADCIVDIASRHARGRRVTKVEVRVGHLRQVVPDALSFAFELVAQGTAVEGAELALEEVPATVRCNTCAAKSVLTAFPACCPSCGSLDVKVAGGEELLVDSLELEEDELLAGMGG